MKYKKRRVVGLVVGSLILGVLGCGKQSERVESGKVSEVVLEGDIDIWAPYEETITLTSINAENAGIKWGDGEDYDNNPWIKAWKERFNIEVKHEWVSNEYDSKLNLTIADGDLPDVFKVSATQLQQLVEADLVVDMTQLFDVYASDTLKGYMEFDEATYKTGFYNDKLYGIPQMGYGIIDQPDQVWIRKDWKDKLQLEDPKTIEDLENIAKAFMEEYGGHAITENQKLESMKVMAPAWGAYPEIWVEDGDGTITYGSIQPEMKEVLRTYARWYKDGIIDPEFTVNDQNKMLQSVINGTVGINPFYQWWGYFPGPDVITNLGKEAEFEAYAIPSANGNEVKAAIEFANIGYVVVSKDCKNPEAVVKLLNFYAYMMDDSKGVESEEFLNSLFGNAMANVAFTLRVINPETDYMQFVEVTEALKDKSGTAENLGKNYVKYSNSIDFLEKGASTGIGDWSQQGSPKSAYKIAKEMLDKDLIVQDKIWGRKPEALLNAGSTLDDILLEGFTKIIVGEVEIDYFDTLVETWRTAGGTLAIEEVNEMYGTK